MRLLVLGQGKTGALVAEVARKRGHVVRAMASGENQDGRALTLDLLKRTEVVIDFTTPQAVIPNIIRCAEAQVPIVVGTTGWYQHLDKVRSLVGARKTAFLYGSDFFVGVNFFFKAVQALALILKNNYHPDIVH